VAASAYIRVALIRILTQSQLATTCITLLGLITIPIRDLRALEASVALP